jgi:hypothetical protein
MSWSASEYAEHVTPRQNGQNTELEDHLNNLFPGKHTASRTFEDQPMIVIDKEDNILLWYLPGLFTTKALVR